MKEKRILDVLGQVDDQYIEESAPAKYESQEKKRAPAFIKWGYMAACLALILAFAAPLLIRSWPFSASARKGMFTVGTPWETDEFTFCVVDAGFCSSFETEAGELLTPGDGCRFLAVKYRTAFSNGTLSKCALKKGDVYSQDHTDYLGPIPIADGGSVLLFSIPLAESDADTPSQNSYSIRVEIDAGGRTYVQDFAL